MPDYELYQRCADGDSAAQESLLHMHNGLIYMVLNRFRGRGIEEDDMYQLAAIGLLKAAARFDVALGVQFSTYAVPVMMGEIRRQLRDNGPVKVSRSYKELAAKAAKAREALTRQLGREPSLSEIAHELTLPPEELSVALSAVAVPVSLDEPVESTGDPLKDTLSCEDYADSVVTRLALRNAVAALSPRERDILHMRYIAEQTQSRIAAQYGISQVQVSRIEKKILQKLRQMLNAEPLAK